MNFNFNSPYAGLTAKIPHLELEVFVCDLFDVEADGGNRRDHFAHLQPVQDCRLAGAVQPQDQYAHLAVPQKATEVAE